MINRAWWAKLVLILEAENARQTEAMRQAIELLRFVTSGADDDPVDMAYDTLSAALNTSSQKVSGDVSRGGK